MRNLKLLALTATFVVATAGLAVAGDCDKSTETAQAKANCTQTATAQTASVKAEGGCSSTAAAQTAGAAGCASSAAVKTASAEGGCASSASAVKTAGAEGGCSSSAMAASGCSTSAKAIKVETVRMPSGAMAVFYNGTNAESVAFLQASAEKGCTGFACNLAKSMAADENCKVEMAKTEHGVMMLVTSEKADVVEKYAQQYAAVTATADASSDE